MISQDLLIANPKIASNLATTDEIMTNGVSVADTITFINQKLYGGGSLLESVNRSGDLRFINRGELYFVNLGTIDPDRIDKETRGSSSLLLHYVIINTTNDEFTVVVSRLGGKGPPVKAAQIPFLVKDAVDGDKVSNALASLIVHFGGKPYVANFEFTSVEEAVSYIHRTGRRVDPSFSCILNKDTSLLTITRQLRWESGIRGVQYQQKEPTKYLMNVKTLDPSTFRYDSAGVNQTSSRSAIPRVIMDTRNATDAKGVCLALAYIAKQYGWKALPY